MSPPEIMLVHGLWFGPWSMARLGRNLRRRGFGVRRFAYRSTAADLQDHANALAAFARQTGAARLHFVAHSLGGLVTLRMLQAHPDVPDGRVVLIGSPLRGSGVARRAHRIPGAEKLLGEIRSSLEQGYRQLPGNRETGMIAGSRSIGLGMLVGGAGKVGDGTVGLLETRNRGLKDHLVLPVTHTGMLFSREVARQAAEFLSSGRFERPPA